MSIRTVQCPACEATVNVPAAMANVRCPACGNVWNAHQPATPKPAPAATSQKSATSKNAASPAFAIIALIVGGMLVTGLIGVVVIQGWDFSSIEDAASAPAENTANVEAPSDESLASPPNEPEPYRIVNVSESKRRRIYKDCCDARTATQNQLQLPSGSIAQTSFDGLMGQILERELKRFAAIHDVRLEDMYEVMKEGDAKNWRADQ